MITHAHEDHIGAVAWLWPQLRCPVYATPFAAAVLRRKLGEAGLVNQVKMQRRSRRAARSTCKPFALRFIRLSHSIPEAQALVIETPAGIVLHTGDWKLDPNPLVGPPTDEAALAALGDKGVLAMVCDSTNAMVEGHSGSELDVRSKPDSADPRPEGPRRGDLLRQQCRAHGIDRAGGAGGRPQRGAGRPIAAQHGRGGAGMRVFQVAAAVPDRGRHRRRAGRKPADDGHRQPGRAAQRAVAHRAATTIRGCRSGKGTR